MYATNRSFHYTLFLRVIKALFLKISSQVSEAILPAYQYEVWLPSTRYIHSSNRI